MAVDFVTFKSYGHTKLTYRHRTGVYNLNKSETSPMLDDLSRARCSHGRGAGVSFLLTRGVCSSISQLYLKLVSNTNEASLSEVRAHLVIGSGLHRAGLRRVRLPGVGTPNRLGYPVFR